jgi:AcrR family transcriptional regulator
MSQMRESSSDQTVGTRDRILITATRLFAEHGYDHTSLAQVAREAHVSKALVLWHFDSKAKLFRAALGRTLEPFYIDVGDLKDLDEATQIERLIDLFYEFVRENVYSVRFMLSLIASGDKQPGEFIGRIRELYGVFRRLLGDVIDRGRRTGRFRPDVRPLLDSALIVAALDGILIEHFLDDQFPDDPSELIGYLKRTAIDRLIA